MDPVTQRFHDRPKLRKDGSLDHWNPLPGFMYKKLYNSAAGAAMAHCPTTVQNMDEGLEVQAVGEMQEVPLPEPVFDTQEDTVQEVQGAQPAVDMEEVARDGPAPGQEEELEL